MDWRRLACVPLFLVAAGAAAQTAVIDLPTNDLIYDPGAGVLYASVPGSAGSLGNTVTVIDPATGAVGPSVFVGSEPNPLAISDDGSYLYVGLDGAGSVRRVDLASFTAGLEFPLGSDPFFGPYYAEDIEVQPGNPDVVAVSRRFNGVSPRHGGVGIYDNGVVRTNATARHTGSNVIEFSDTAATLYGYNNETTEFGFRRMAVDASGVTIIDVTRNLISGFGVDIEHEDGAVFATSGAVVDPVGLALLGTYPGVVGSAAVVAAADLNRTYFLSGDTIETFLLSSFTFLQSETFAGVSGSGQDLVRWGTDGLAFRTTGDQVFLVAGTDLPDADGDGVADFADNCPDVSNPTQDDADLDGLGDACDPYPNEPDNLGMCLNELSTCQDDLALCQQDNAALQAQIDQLLDLLADTDGDGVLDSTELCPGTPGGQTVDLGGCSHAQFCARWTSRGDCKAADWMNDEPVKADDCRWQGGSCLPTSG